MSMYAQLPSRHDLMHHSSPYLAISEVKFLIVHFYCRSYTHIEDDVGM